MVVIDFLQELEILIRARYPLIWIQTVEETRAREIVEKVARGRNKRVVEWTSTGGLVSTGTSLQSRQRDSATRDPLVALENVIQLVEPALFVFYDLHPYLGKANPTVVRKLKDIALQLKNSAKTLLLVSPVLDIPLELEKEITVLPLPLPGYDEMHELLARIQSELAGNASLKVDLSSQERDRLLSAVRGLSLSEAENVFARLLVKHGRLSGDLVGEVAAEKQQFIRRSGLLDYIEPSGGLDQIGGMQSFKVWLNQRSLGFTPEARTFGLPPPRGVLLLGIQGCGKSLSAKAVATQWQLPLLRFDLGRVFGSFIGSSEENIRRAIQVAEAVAPAVLWVDEIDKAFAGLHNGGGDSGTGARVLGSFLTWLGEKTAPVFVVATANDISQLPAELLRKGRFDEIFFVDLPTLEERVEILKVHIERRGRQAELFDLVELASRTPDFSGAELEEAIVSGMFEAFSQGTEVQSEHLVSAALRTVPLSKTMAESVARLRAWASGRARSAA